ncbi:cysteine desulfurase family protein [Aestuariimicrobium sp. T2.26MG-19.2B]|uniref:cysteine desulfurase family protein n=1 Tax=Aestuariimicrobium sp. T2.26MG-19.2B TaxID=3040679 RepID=UPI0024777B40|nr:aminotransferase class V-fold PLP-dependent enzyme [Aestuariimicrobium sp. T2.26MG-19.2B]CAI9410278.1 IscS-like cysteine desulfurase [Aestuariimicrobium sp. T2.26MG-19.2B]
MAAEATRHYFDHAAHSPLRPAARQAWLQAADLVGNPAALHASARRSRAALEDARESIAADLGAHPTEVVLTSGGSEADTLAVWGGVRGRASSGRDLVVISAVEHPAVGELARQWPGTLIAGVDPTGSVMMDELARLVGPSTAVVSVQTVNNEVGVVQPVAEAAEIAHAAGAWFHTDAVQALVSPGLDFSASAADLVSVSAHKLGGPVGVGALLVRREVAPAVTGLGGRQERDLRSGTQSAALAAAFAAALHESVASREAERVRMARLRAELLAGLAAAGQGEGVRVNGGEVVNPAIVHLTAPGVRADDVLLLLDRVGIDASVGSACRAGVHQPSEVVLAMTGSTQDALSSLRFSMGWSTTDDDVAALVRELPRALARARGV